MGNAASNSWATNYRLLKQIHDDAYKTIDNAIKLEEQEKPNEAIEKYKQGIFTIDKALDVVIACPDEPDETWRDACNMVQKMKKTRAEVLQRINAITSAPGFVQMEPPPSYDEAIGQDQDVATPRTYTELATALDNLKLTTPRGKADILLSCEGVQLYFISPDGNVAALEPQTLNIATIEDNSETSYFLQIGSWIYPLVPGVSPCYRTEYRAFIFPDVHSAVEGSSVGIVIPEDADELIHDILEDILLGVVSTDRKKRSLDELRDPLKQGLKIEPETASRSGVANTIVNGAGYVSKGLVFTASKLNDFLNYGTPKIISSINPAPDQAAVPTPLRKTFKFAESTTGKAAEVTGIVATKLGVATSKLGQFLAPHVERQGTKLLTYGFKMSEQEASSKVNGVLSVAAGAVEGFGTIYQGLQTSAGILGNSIKDNSVKIVQHKYGHSAGALANDTLGTVGNVISIRGNVKIFTPKGLAKTTAKQTGKALVRSAVFASVPIAGSSNMELSGNTSQSESNVNIDTKENISHEEKPSAK